MQVPSTIILPKNSTFQGHPLCFPNSYAPSGCEEVGMSAARAKPVRRDRPLGAGAPRCVSVVAQPPRVEGTPNRACNPRSGGFERQRAMSRIPASQALVLGGRRETGERARSVNVEQIDPDPTEAA
jgi:hypothetical protein